MKTRPAILFDHLNIAVSDRMVLPDFSWQVQPGEPWLIVGPNGSGKSAVVAALCGETDPAPLNIFAGDCELLSFDRQQEIILQELRNDESDFVEGGVDPGTKVRQFILNRLPAQPAETDFRGLTQELDIERLLDHGIKYLSTGELRKVLLCRALLRKPGLLVLDEPYQGLDSQTRGFLERQLSEMIAAGSPHLIIVADQYQGMPAGIRQVMCLENCQVVFAGLGSDFEASAVFHRLFATKPETASATEFETVITGPETTGILSSVPAQPPILVRMRNVMVAWDGRRVLDGFDWVLPQGEHTLIRGPNGCGKTTLLRLITGDNPQVFANDVSVFGMQRGSGESIWDIKRQLGLVSYQFHLDYLYHGQASLEETLLSGFHDSIGLYEQPGHSEVQQMHNWIEILGMNQKRSFSFNALSWGEQRLALIARAAIKGPRLLILDEPCHGLDMAHRRQVLDMAEYIGNHTETTLLHVTHDPTEYLACTRKILDFEAVLNSDIGNNSSHSAFRPVWSQGFMPT